MKATRAVVPSIYATTRARLGRVALVAGSSALLTAAAISCSSPIEGEGEPVSVPSFPGGTVNPLNPIGNGGSSGNDSVNGTVAQCQPGSVRCVAASRLETCNTLGTGFDVTTCDSGLACIAGACRQLSCTAGFNLCLGNELHTCNADGKSTTLSEICSGNEGCQSSTLSCEPKLCEPLLGTCNGNVATRCDSTGFAYDFAVNTDCGGQTCMAGACRSPELPNPLDPIVTPPTEVAGACTANQVSCVGNNLVTCNAQGTSSTSQSCGAGTCNPAAATPSCVAPQICTPNETSCDGPALFGNCSADGRTLTSERCPNGTTCQGPGNCTPVACNPQGLTSFDGGEATVYWFGQGTINFGDIACGFGIDPGDLNNGSGDAVNGITNPTMFVAINTANYRGSASCGACVQMTYQGRSVTATVVDECPIGSNPTCTAGHLDLSRGAWNALTNNAAGTQIFGVNWDFVPCPTTGGVTIQLKEPTNEYWNQFLVRGHRFPIARAEVEMEDGTWVQASRTPYNYFEPPEGVMGTYRVRVTDVNGAVIEEQLELAGGAQGGASQFECR